jgi:hypothetical protein
LDTPNLPSVTVAKGSTATFTDASPVFELNVWNREANQALPGQFETLEWAKLRQESGHS